jgi:hypothetical protein
VTPTRQEREVVGLDLGRRGQGGFQTSTSARTRFEGKPGQGTPAPANLWKLR